MPTSSHHSPVSWHLLTNYEHLSTYWLDNQSGTTNVAILVLKGHEGTAMNEDVVLILHIETRDTGVIPFEAVADLLGHFQKLITAIGKEVAPKMPVAWGVSRMALGSLMTEIRPIHANLAGARVGRDIMRAAGEVAAFAQSGDIATMPFSAQVREEITAMLRGLTDDAPAFQIENREKQVRLTRAQLRTIENRGITWGTVSGIADGIDNHVSPRFTLYDDVFDNPIRCQLREGITPFSLRDLFEQRVEVEGLIAADPQTGVIRTVTEIEEVRIIDTSQADYRKTEGVWRDWQSTAAERLEALRRVRHGE